MDRSPSYDYGANLEEFQCHREGRESVRRSEWFEAFSTSVLEWKCEGGRNGTCLLCHSADDQAVRLVQRMRIAIRAGQLPVCSTTVEHPNSYVQKRRSYIESIPKTESRNPPDHQELFDILDPNEDKRVLPTRDISANKGFPKFRN